jgi:hypothetical protein
METQTEKEENDGKSNLPVECIRIAESRDRGRRKIGDRSKKCRFHREGGAIFLVSGRSLHASGFLCHAAHPYGRDASGLSYAWVADGIVAGCKRLLRCLDAFLLAEVCRELPSKALVTMSSPKRCLGATSGNGSLPQS